MFKRRLLAIIILIAGVAVGYFVYATQIKHQDSKYAFKLGLDLSGGTQLIYRADVSEIDQKDVKGAMSALRDVIERRVNLFGVAETNVQVQEANFANGQENRLIVDLPGITDIKQATEMIGQTPLLEFKTERPDGPEKDKLLKDYRDLQARAEAGENIPINEVVDPYYVSTDLTGRYLKSASLDFGQNQGSVGQPVVNLEFNKEGSDIFEKLTEENVGKILAIYLDGAPISTPVVNSAISGGHAVISGNFTPDEARTLVGRLNSGALPVPIELVSTQSVGPSLGAEATQAGVFAGLIGFIILGVLMIVWYRLPGVVAVVALAIYIALMCGLIKVIPITLTAAGIAGFVISLGLAVDGNILIAERLKEEIRDGRAIGDAIKVGFERAWYSIRDSNLSSIISAIILFWFGSSLVQGFALTLGVGSIVSMFSAVTVSRMFLLAVNFRDSRAMKFLFSSGFSK